MLFPRSGVPRAGVAKPAENQNRVGVQRKTTPAIKRKRGASASEKAVWWLEAERGDRLRGGALEREKRSAEREKRKTGESGAQGSENGAGGEERKWSGGRAKESEIGGVGTYVYTRAAGRQAKGGGGGVGPRSGSDLLIASHSHFLTAGRSDLLTAKLSDRLATHGTGRIA